MRLLQPAEGISLIPRMANGGAGGKKQLNRNQLFKRQKVRDARTIRTEAVRVDTRKSTGASDAGSNNSADLSESGGILKVPGFVSSREFEMKELQFAMLNSKCASSTRVFQSLPRQLRRRTASHNVKRIPKRMRNRALREMAKNDPKSAISDGKHMMPKKSKKRHGLSAAQLYRAKMSVKLLRLASKSASMKLALPEEVLSNNKNTRSKIKSLRLQIKAARKHPFSTRNNKMGSYDNSLLNGLAPVPKNRLKFLKRQRFFTWLPTHIWNAKRSHMIKRWGFQIPWSPTQKCFRMTHRLGGNSATSDGALCMDTSFNGTMILRDLPNQDGNTDNLKSIISKLAGKRSVLKKYRVSRYWFEGLAFDIESEDPAVLGPIDMLWVDEHCLLIRLHPSIYSNIFQSLLAKHGDVISLEDCRYSLGSITLKGAKSLNALSSIIRTNSPSISFQQLTSAAKLADTSVLPQRTMFAFQCTDPRHLAAPKIATSNFSKAPTVDDVLNLQKEFPSEEISETLQILCDQKKRTESYANQQTLKQLAARRRKLFLTSPCNEYRNMIPHNTKTDPSIPLLIVRRERNDDWVLMLPWFWVLPFWYQLKKVSRVYHMGLRQLHQLSFENHKLYFPVDWPFTDIGYLENSVYQRDTRKLKWEKKPVGKRVNFARLLDIHKEEMPSFRGEIGDYFSCDWKLLQILRNGLGYLTEAGENPKLCEKGRTTQFDSSGSRAILVLNDVFEFYKDVTLNSDHCLDNPRCLPIKLIENNELENRPTSCEEPAQVTINETPLLLRAISCTCPGKGHPKDNARIYQIPEEDVDYWRSIKKGQYRSDGRINHDLQHPLPRVSDLIGFVTSGAYHLGEGRGVANGFIDAKAASKLSTRDLLIRNVGSNTYRVVEWNYINV